MKRIRGRFQLAASLIGATVVLLAGYTGRPSRVHQLDYSSSAGADAIEAYDADGDDAIGGAEFERVPGLRESLQQVDADGDGLVTAEEIDARVQSWRDSQVAEIAVMCQILLDGAPLADAQVTFEPEPFLGEDVVPANATTNASGTSSVSMADEHLADPRYPGVACGWYKVRVTSNARKIPPQYNTETTLGCEVAMNTHWTNQASIQFKLKSK